MMTDLPKSAWGDGPWQSEPDQEIWADPDTDLPCLAVRGPFGAWCGYVGVPPDHPAHGLSYYKSEFSIEEIEAGLGGKLAAQKVVNDIEVHGGLTFAGKRDYVFPETARCRDWHFFGFDCSHAGDYDPLTAALLSNRKPGHPRALGAPTGWGSVIEYRDLAYVKGQCASLAKQLAAIVETQK